MGWNDEQGRGEKVQAGWTAEKCDCSKALAADRARIAAAIRVRKHPAMTDSTRDLLADLLRVVECG